MLTNKIQHHPKIFIKFFPVLMLFISLYLIYTFTESTDSEKKSEALPLTDNSIIQKFNKKKKKSIVEVQNSLYGITETESVWDTVNPLYERYIMDSPIWEWAENNYSWPKEIDLGTEINWEIISRDTIQYVKKEDVKRAALEKQVIKSWIEIDGDTVSRDTIQYIAPKKLNQVIVQDTAIKSWVKVYGKEVSRNSVQYIPPSVLNNAINAPRNTYSD